MKDRLSLCQVHIAKTLADTLWSLERSNVKISLVVDDEARLVGTLTDGDVRRALLGGTPLSAPLAPYVQRNFVSVRPSAGRTEVLELMQSRVIGQIPIVDEGGRLVGLHLLQEMLGSTERRNWAIVMAGGRGQRLRPITELMPKPMVKVAGRPILERIILHLVGYGIRRIFVSVHYMAEVIERHFGDGHQFGCRIDYLREERPLGTGGALSLLPEVPEEPLLALNGDLLTQFDVGALLAFHELGGYTATVAIHEYAHTVPFGVVDAKDGRVRRMREKPTFTWYANAGIYVLGPGLPERVPREGEFPLPSLIDACLERGEPVGAYPIDGDWIDIGRSEELLRARGEGRS